MASIVTLLSDTGAPLIQFRGGLPLVGQDAERCSLCSWLTFALCASDVISNQVLVCAERVSCCSRPREHIAGFVSIRETYKRKPAEMHTAGAAGREA